MYQQGANPPGFGAGDGSSRAFLSKTTRRIARGVAATFVLLTAALFAAPAAAQSATTVTISGSRPATFARVNQVLTFNVDLSTGNTDIDSLSFTSGSPTGMSAVSCPGMPAALGTVKRCTFSYIVQPMDMAMGTITALGRWRATRPSGASRSGTTNTLVVTYAPPRAPDAPVIGSVSAGNTQATVAFTAPDFDGGWPVDSYTVTSVPGGITATGASGPITVTGLTNGVAYRFNVTATNQIGTGAASANSNSVTPIAPQTLTFANPGAQTFGTTPTLIATASSGLTPTFASGTTSVCTITAGGALTFVSAGTCTITASQAGNAAFSAAAPVSQSFTVNAIAPDAPTIGTATAADAQATVTFTAPASTGGSAITGYTLTSNPGGLTATGAASPITLTGLTNFTAYTFTVTANNSAGTSAASAASNSVVPSTNPVVTAVTAPANGLYGPGATLDLTVQWDQPVDVTGTPRIALTIGASTVQADYVSGSGTAATLFRYIVLAGQTDADGIAIGALNLAGGTIRNVPGRDANLTLNAVGSTAGVLVGVNNQAPVLSVPSAQSVEESDALSFAAGNALSVADVDAGSSAVRMILSVSHGSLALSGSTGLSFITGASSGVASMSFEGSVADINAALNGLVYRPTPGYFGGDALQVGVDDRGNSGFGGAKSDAGSVAITITPLDHVPPAVTSIDRVDANPTRATSVQFSVAFSEAVSGVDAGDFSVVGTGSANGSVASVVALDAAHYTVTVDGITGDGTLRLDLAASANVADAAGNAAAAFSAGQTYLLDNTAPSVLSVAVPANAQYVAGQVLVFTINLSEAVSVTGTPRLPLTLNVGGARDATYTGGNGTSALTFSYTVATGDQDLDGVALATQFDLNGGTVADMVGNAATTTLNSVADTSGVQVGLRPQTITGFVANPAAPAYAPNAAFTVSATGGASTQPLVFATTTSSVCAVAGNTVTTLSAGTCSLTANQAGDATHEAAAQQTLDVVIARGSQAITFGAQTAQTFAPNATFALRPLATANSNLPVSYTSQTTTVCTISGNTVTTRAAGSCIIAADQAGDTNYAAAAPVTQTISAFVANPTTPVYAPNGTFTVSASGGASGQPVVFATTTAAVCSVNGNTATMRTAGTCALTATQAGDANHAASPMQTLDVVIGAGAQTLSFAAQSAQTFTANATFALSPLATSSSGLAVTYTSQTAGVCSISGTTVTMLAAGTCTIAANQVGDANYSAASQVTQSIAIGKAAQAISAFVANPTAPVYAPNGTFTVSATGGASGQPLVFASGTAAVCTVNGSTVTMRTAGTCTLTADQAGGVNHQAAPRQTLNVVIGKASPTLTWAVDISKTYGEAAFELPAPTSSSPGAITYSSGNTQVATLSGRTVTLTGAGSTVLTATQAASDSYAAASITLRLTVNGRPDPTQDATVVANLQAQVDASVRFAQTQQDNIRSRLGQLRAGGNASSNAVTLKLHGAGQSGVSLGTNQLQGTMPTMPQGWGVWTAGAVVLGERDARDGGQGFDFHSDGLSAGVDRSFGHGMTVGVAGGLGWADSDLDDGRSSFDARQHSVSVYGLWRADALFVDGIIGLGRLDFDIQRWSTPADAMATAQREGDQRFASLTLGYELRGAHSTLTGYGRLDASRTSLDAYRETGTGIYDLQYADQSLRSSTAAAGIEGRYLLRTSSALVRPYWNLEWREALQNQGVAGVNYVVVPSSSDYTLGLRSYNDDMLGLGAGVDFGFDNGWSLAFQLRREQSHDVAATAFGIHVAYGQSANAASSLMQQAEQPEQAMDNSQR